MSNVAASTASAAAAEKKAAGTDFAARAASEPTDLHKAFAAWIEEQTGIKPDLKTVQIVCSMRMDFQKSEDNQKALKAKRAKVAAEKAKRDEALKAKKLAQLKKLQAELGLVTAEGDPAADEAKKLVADAVEKTEVKAEVEAVENQPEQEAAKATPKPRARRAPARKAAATK